MIRPAILILIIIIRVSFLIYEDSPYMWEYKVTGKTVPMVYFVWMLNEFVSVLAITIMSIFRDTRYLFTQQIFTVVAFFDLCDFALTGNTVWWHWGNIPISMNILGIGIFGIGLIYEICKPKIMNSYT